MPFGENAFVEVINIKTLLKIIREAKTATYFVSQQPQGSGALSPCDMSQFALRNPRGF
jgi:hypothetical protein